MESIENKQAAIIEFLADRGLDYEQADAAYEVDDHSLMQLELAGVSQPVRQYLGMMMEIILNYLNAPIITDEFGADHGKRRRVEDDITKELQEANLDDGSVFKRNKLGSNTFHNLYPILGRLESIASDEDKKIPAIQKMLELAKELPGLEFIRGSDFAMEYLTMPLSGKCDQLGGKYEGKLGFVKEMTRVVKEIVGLCR